VENKTMIAK